MRILLTLALLASSWLGQAAELPGEGAFNVTWAGFPGYRDARLAAFAKNKANDAGAVVFLGDSITEGWNLGQAFPGMKTANRGISGDTSRGMVVRLADNVTDLKPSAVVLMCGINDLFQPGGTPASIAANVRTMVTAIHQAVPAAPVYVCETLPSGSLPFAKVQETNAAVDQALAGLPGVCRVRLYAAYLQADGTQNASLFKDKTHPNAAGYVIWQEKLAAEFGQASALALIRRILPQQADRFSVELIPATAAGNDVFEIEAVNGLIVLRGNRPVAIASACNHYLKHIAKCQLSWCGDQLRLPEPLPLPPGKIRQESPYRHGFAFNYCTFNYTMAWWDWARWEREIDFMALNGVDLPLAIVGAEATWLNFLQRFGYTKDQAKAFIAGPGYTAWWLMGNLEGRGGPVSDEWIASRVELQKKILARMRELGMRPVLPGFVGLVPNSLPQVRPGTRILDQGQWGGDQRPAVLHPDDPLFAEMGKAWYEEQDKLYGRNDAFAGDLFHEGGNAHGLDVPAIAARVQGLMLAYNPQSLWTLQGWGGNPRADLLKGLKKENTLVVELCCEFWRNWEKSQGFHGTPWIFSTVTVYGGNVALHGRLPAVAGNLADALKSSAPPAGLGMTWESIDSNPVVIDFLWDMRWRKEIPDLDTWVGDYAARRYGADLPPVRAAWQTILHTAYGSYPDHRRPTESIFCAKPSLNVTKVSPFAASIAVHYDQRQFRDAVKMLLEAAPQCGAQAGYRYDIVDFTRQFLANVAQIPYREMVAAAKAGDKPGFAKASGEFLAMLDDQDRLLGADSHFLLGAWLDAARRCAPTPEQALQNERNARWLITTWTEKPSGLGDYAWREWNGLLRNYYRPRWEWFIDGQRMTLEGIMAKRMPMEAAGEEWKAKTWDNDPYPVQPQGDGLAIAKEILAKWGPMLDDPKRYTPPAAKSPAKEEAAEAGR